MPSRSILHGLGRATAFVFSALPFAPASVPRLGADAARLGIEGRPAARLQRDQVRPRAAREAEVEADVVVDRIEGAHRHEVEIAPFGIERRRRIAELGLGERGRRLRRHRIQPERDVARVGRVGVGEPGAVGRPGEVVAAAVLARIDGDQRAALDVADPDFVAMIGERDLAADRRRDERADVAGVPRQRARRAVGGEDDEALFARRVARGDHRRAVGEPLAAAQAPGRRALGAGARGRRPAAPESSMRRVGAPSQSGIANSWPRATIAIEWPAGCGLNHSRCSLLGDEATRRLGAVRRRLDRQLAGRALRRIEQPEARAAHVDDAPAVALRLARVAAVVVGVAAHVAAVGAT